MLSDKCRHVKLRLCRRIGMFLADRASVARAATRRPAIIGFASIFIAADMAGATLHVIDTRLKRVHRTGT